jgi:hypothetical protein
MERAKRSPQSRAFAAGLRLAIVSSAAEVKSAGLGAGAFGFFAGPREEVEADLGRALRGTAWSWKHVRTWESMEKRERSIHAYLIMPSGVSERRLERDRSH